MMANSCKSHYSLEKYEDNFAKVFVKGFGSTLDDECLRKWFAKRCDNVQSAKVANAYGSSLGYGYVCFCSSQDAERAIPLTNGTELNGSILSVEPFSKTKKHKEMPFRNVFVKGFGETLDDKKLRIYFRDHVGDVESAEVAKENDVSKGYGYVSFYKWQDAMKAVHEINRKKIHGNTLIVEPFIPKEQRRQELNRNVYVKGFEEMCDYYLHKLFEIFGETESVKVERDDNGVSMGYGYVCFSRWQDAEAAISKMNGYKLGSRILTVCPFQSREEREKEIKNKNLHIRNLHSSVSDVELKKLFEPYGRILNACIYPSPLQGINQGYVCFKKAEEADDAIAALNHYFYKGMQLKVSVHQDKKTRETGMKGCSPLTTQVQNRTHLKNLGAPSFQNVKKNVGKDKSNSARNLNRNNGKSRIAAKFCVNRSNENQGSSAQNIIEDSNSKGILNFTSKPKRYSNCAGNYTRNLDETVQAMTLEENVSEQEEPVKSGHKRVIRSLWNTP